MFWQSRPGNADTNIFVLDNTGQRTYREIFELADNLFSSLSRGVAAIICDKDWETVIGYVGRFAPALSPCFLDSTAEEASLLHLIDRYEANICGLVRASHPTAMKKSAALTIKYYGSGVRPQARAQLAWTLRLIPTSGSTGDPKSVRLSQQNLSKRHLLHCGLSGP